MDIEGMPERPALSATSDSPIVAAPEPAPVAEPAEPAAPATPAVPTEPVAVEPEPTEPTEPATADPPARDRSMGGRLSELARQRTAAEQRADRLAESLEKAIDMLGRAQPQPTTPITTAPSAPEPRPSREQFADPDLYDTALVEWSARTATQVALAQADAKAAEDRKASETRTAEEAAQRQWQETTTAWESKRQTLADNPDYADFDDVVMGESARQVPIPESTVPIIMNLDNGPQVLYHLCKTPAEAERIAKLTPLQQAIALGAMSERIARPPVVAPRTLPRPIEPVGARNNAGPKTNEEHSADEWAAKRLPELRSERRASMWGRPTGAA